MIALEKLEFAYERKVFFMFPLVCLVMMALFVGEEKKAFAFWKLVSPSLIYK